MKENAPKPSETTYLRAQDWLEANQHVKELVDGKKYGLGATANYPDGFTLMYKDALSGQGSGFYLFEYQNGKMKRIVADISVGRRPSKPDGV